MTEPSTSAGRTAGALWWRYWGAMRRYHRYEAHGLEHLEGGPALVVGYHGRPIAHDLCMLQSLLRERTGRWPRAFVHAAFDAHPALRAVVDGAGFLTGEDDALRAAVARGDHLVVTPGGTREGCRSSRVRYRVDWGRRRGYLALARKLALPIVPAAGLGVDDTYLALNDGDAWGKRLGAPMRLPVWIGVGPLGLWPLSPPFPVKVRTVLGPRITAHLDAPSRTLDEGSLEALHATVAGAVQGLLDRAMVND